MGRIKLATEKKKKEKRENINNLKGTQGTDKKGHEWKSNEWIMETANESNTSNGVSEYIWQ